MSATEQTRPVPRAFVRLLRSEITLIYRRRRNQALLVVLAAGPALIGVAIRSSSHRPHDGGDGPQFLDRVSGNGLFLVFTGLVVMLPLFLPLAVSVVAGDSIAGEASTGTLRALLTAPVSRTRLLATKALACVVFTTSGVFAVAAAALATGAALFPIGRVTLLSGDTVSLGVGLERSLVITGYVAMSLLGLIAVGLLFSVLTEVPVAAMALTLGFVIVTAVLDAVPQLSGLHPFLLTHHWQDFAELLRFRPRVDFLLSGVRVQLAYVLIAGALAWARFRTHDITS